MKVSLILISILSFCAFTFAAESVGFFKDPAHPGKCVFENLILSPGDEAKLSGGCGRFLCGADSFGTIQTCGIITPPPGCKLGDFVDKDAPYGKCCERKIVC